MNKSPITWFGGKYFMAKDIIPLFPEHLVYIEGFGGAGHILFRKEKSKKEVYNDLHKGLFNFFTIIKDKEKRELLQLALSLTPYSREEFLFCKDNWETEKDLIESTRMFYVSTMQSINNAGESWSFSKSQSRRGMAQCVSQFLNHIDINMENATERLKEVSLENLDIIDLIKKYDSEKTFFYLDPPYVKDTRVSKKMYKHEMVDSKHKELIDTVIKVKGKVMISGYDNEIYEKLLENGWKKEVLGVYTKRSNKTNNGKLSKGEEFIWVNY